MVITHSPVLPVAPTASPVSPPRVLVLIDDPAQREVASAALSLHGYSVAAGESAEALYELPAGTHFDIALLDRQLTGEDALSLGARLRRIHPFIGLVMLGAHDSPDERVAAYRHGADICLGKPAVPAELCAALDALVRRLNAHLTPAGDAPLLELASCLLHTPNGPLSLRRQEVEALYALALAPGNFLESWQLLARLGKPLDTYGKAQLEVLISRLRSRIRALHPGGNPIRAERGRGYRLELPLQVRG